MSPRAPLTDVERAAITSEALRIGDLRPIMTRTQRLAIRVFRAMASAHTIFVIDCTRRWGKTFFDAMLVHMEATRGQDRIIRYVAPTKLHGRQFVIPAFAWLHAQLPESVRPKFLTQDNTWIWPNGSRCHLGSAETMGDVEAQVGTACHLAIVDEAGKVRSDLLKHLVRSVLRAQFLTTGGNIVVTSTPAISPAHFLKELVNEATVAGALARYTIDDCDHVPLHERLKMIDELGGRQCTEVRRELYCEHVTERTRLIVPEWSDVAETCKVAVKRPPWLDWYVIADFGFSDMTVVGFLWYDFARAKLILADELAFQGVAGTEVGYAIKAKEEALGIRNPKRFADATPQLLADIAHPVLGPGISFGLTMKDDSEAAMNALRMRIGKGHIEIDPQCKVTVSHLEYGTWNEARTSFSREAGYGHWDAIDMLKYAVRCVDWRKNPTPSLLPGVEHHTHHIPAHIQQNNDRMRRALRQVNGRRL